MLLPRFLILFASFVLLSPTSDAATVILKWLAPGDDGFTGRALAYDVRYARFPITENNWTMCHAAFEGKPWPQPAGSLEQMEISGLQDRALYFFAVKAMDDAGNWSPVSKVAYFPICETGCIGTRGNVDTDQLEHIDIADLVFLAEFLFGSGPPPACSQEANIDGSANGSIDVADLSYLVEFLFNPLAPPPPICPLGS